MAMIEAMKAVPRTMARRSVREQVGMSTSDQIRDEAANDRAENEAREKKHCSGLRVSDHGRAFVVHHGSCSCIEISVISDNWA